MKFDFLKANLCALSLTLFFTGCSYSNFEQKELHALELLGKTESSKEVRRIGIFLNNYKRRLSLEGRLALAKIWAYKIESPQERKKIITLINQDVPYSPEATYLKAMLTFREDPTLAETLFKRSAEAGFPPAMIQHATIISEKDPTTAIDFLIRASHSKCPQAISFLALVDPAEAYFSLDEYKLLGAQDGSIVFQNEMAVLLSDLDQPEESRYWYRLASLTNKKRIAAAQLPLLDLHKACRFN